MRVWRKIRLEDGSAQMQEVESVADIDTSKPVVFHFLGAVTSSKSPRPGKPVPVKMGKSFSGFESMTNGVLAGGLETGQAEMLFVSYDNKNLPLKALHANVLRDSAVHKDAKEFAQGFLAPLLDAGHLPTMVGYSYGGIFADNVRASLLDHYRGQDCTEEDITSKLQNACLLAIGSVSHAINPDVSRREKGGEFTSVYLNNADDIMARVANASFRKIRQRHEGNLSVVAIDGNRLQILGDVDGPYMSWQDRKDGPEFLLAKDENGVGGSLTVKKHSSEQIIYRDPAGKNMMPAIFERVLRNMVRREGVVNVEDLMREPARPLGQEQDYYSHANRISPEQLAIDEALANKKSWREREAGRKDEREKSAPTRGT